MVLTVLLTCIELIAVLMTLLLGTGVLRLLWLIALFLWQECNISFVVLFSLAAYPIATDQEIRSVTAPLLLGTLLLGGAYKALNELVPVALELWSRLPLLLRLALFGVLLDLSFTLKQLLFS